MSLAQIVQLGKSRQRELVQQKGPRDSRRAHSYENTRELRRRIEVNEQQQKQGPKEEDEEMHTIQTNLTLG